jgi:hypothetical protein
VPKDEPAHVYALVPPQEPSGETTGPVTGALQVPKVAWQVAAAQ